MFKIKEASLIQLLTAYLTICIHVGSLDKVILTFCEFSFLDIQIAMIIYFVSFQARKIITFYKNQVKKNNHVPIKDIKLYNIVLLASARKVR